MPDPSRLRDSTQIVLPCRELAGIREELCEEFTVTIVESEPGAVNADPTDDADGATAASGGDAGGAARSAADGDCSGKRCRIVGSPTVIKAVGDYLARRGVSLP